MDGRSRDSSTLPASAQDVATSETTNHLIVAEGVSAPSLFSANGGSIRGGGDRSLRGFQHLVQPALAEGRVLLVEITRDRAAFIGAEERRRLLAANIHHMRAAVGEPAALAGH